MDKTYCETMGEKPFDWRQWLLTAQQGKTDAKDQSEKSEMAKHWVTCACGNQCAIIPRVEFEGQIGQINPGMPHDAELARLGISFYESVSQREWWAATACLDAIEERSAVLIAEELAKLNIPPDATIAGHLKRVTI